MALMERVSTLLRANLNDLIDRAEDPSKMIKQVILDMENQLMQVKTQVAIAVADLHVLERKRGEDAEKETSWMRKADLAVSRKDDPLARAAIERALSCRKMTAAFDEQIADQKVQVENLKGAFSKLETKLGEARGKADVLAARHRRSRVSDFGLQATRRSNSNVPRPPPIPSIAWRTRSCGPKPTARRSGAWWTTMSRTAWPRSSGRMKWKNSWRN